MIDASIALLKCVIDYGLCIWAFSWFAKRKSENRALFLGSIFLSSLFLFGINMLEIPWLNTIVSAFTLLVLFLVVFYTRWQQALPLALILVTLCVICEFTPPLIILSELHQLATSYGILHNGQLLEQLTAEELDARCSKYLLVRTDNDRRAVDILRKMFPEAICQATVEGLRLFPVGNEAAATASGVLMENGLHVQELAVRSEGLEAYFTALVGGDSHADAG